MKKLIRWLAVSCVIFSGYGDAATSSPVQTRAVSVNERQGDGEVRTGIRCDNGLPISYVAIGGIGLWGDVGLGSLEELSKGCINIPVGLTRSSVTSRSDSAPAALFLGAQTWPNGVVPYVIDSNVPQFWRSAVQAAIDHYSAFSPVRFVQRTNESLFVTIVPMTFDPKSNFCASSDQLGIGTVPYRVVVSMTPPDGCKGDHATPYTGTIIHEFMHVLGFIHEQARSDRGNYLTVNTDCPDTNPSELMAFTEIRSNTNVTPYDYASVMHYPRGECIKGTTKSSILVPIPTVFLLTVYSLLDALPTRQAYMF